MTDSRDSRDLVSAETLAVLADRLGRDQVFGPPVEREGTTLVPVARVRSGSGYGGPKQVGGGGAGIVAVPAGAFSLSRDGKVAWHPAVDVNRIVLGGQLALVGVAVAVALALRWSRRAH